MISQFFQPDSIFWALIKNASLLIALAYVHSLLPTSQRSRTLLGDLGLGILLGLIGITIITAAYPFRDGIIFDTRSILIGVTGLYFGAIPTIVVMAITGAYRLWQGGPVAHIGISVIIASGMVGLVWRHLRKPDLARISWRELIAFGFSVHLVMLAIFFGFPSQHILAVFAIITFPVLGIYPLVTAVLGRLLSSRLQRVSDARLLRDSEERFDLILKGANDGWWDWDLTDNQLTYSPRWWEMIGLKPGDREVSPELWRELMHPDDLERVNARFKRALEAGEEQYEVEFRLCHADGHYINVISRGHVQRDKNGKPVRVSGTNVDITAMRRALNEANAAKSLLESAGRIGRIGYWEIFFEGSTLFWSDITAEIHDLPPGTQVPLDQAMKYFAEEFHELIESDARRMREEARPFESEYQLITSKGRRIWVLARGEPVFSVDQRVIGMRGVFQDISERKALEQRAREGEKMESLGRLAGGIAHDFNNMLGVIIGHADLANHRIRSGESVDGDLAQIRHAADRSADLVRQLLNFARRQVIAPRIIDLNLSVHATLTMLRRLIGENIELRWSPEEGVWPVRMDPVQFDQVLTNLVLNARDAIEGHGTITIRTRNTPGVSGSGDGDGDRVTLEVSDDGVGMDPETLKHVFEPFFTTKSLGKGTGLGLASVHGIVQQNGGIIEVSSTPGGGTTFLIHLPRQEPQAGATVAGASSPSPNGSETILLVEDEPAILFLSSEALRIKGYQVLAAASPTEALEIASRADQAIELVVSDMIMPGMNGRQLREEILARRPGLRFLFVSGYTDGLTDNLAGNPGVGFLAKPFSAESLAAKARELIDRDR